MYRPLSLHPLQMLDNVNDIVRSSEYKGDKITHKYSGHEVTVLNVCEDVKTVRIAYTCLRTDVKVNAVLNEKTMLEIEFTKEYNFGDNEIIIKTYAVLDSSSLRFTKEGFAVNEIGYRVNWIKHTISSFNASLLEYLPDVYSDCVKHLSMIVSSLNSLEIRVFQN